jgi:hypothetical protein
MTAIALSSRLLSRSPIMPAKDRLHNVVRHALEADGWTITHDPLILKFGLRELFVDLGAERLLAASKADQKIAVEVKGFSGPSDITDLERALGQFTLYHEILSQSEPDRRLYLAVPEDTAGELFNEPIGQLLLQNRRLRVFIFDSKREVILRWIPSTETGTSSSAS